MEGAFVVADRQCTGPALRRNWAPFVGVLLRFVAFTRRFAVFNQFGGVARRMERVNMRRVLFNRTGR